MSAHAKREYVQAIYQRYRQARRPEKRQILDEFCQVAGYHRKHAIRLLNRPAPGAAAPRRRRAVTYSAAAIDTLRAIWEAAGYPWSRRLHALLPLWLPWARRRFRLRAAVEQQLVRISPRQMDRRLAPYRRALTRRLYGRTKPGTLLKHHIPLKTDRWNVTTPGFTEIDLVAHSGSWGDGEFVHSLNLTDIHTTWVETAAVLGKGQAAVQAALEELRQALPFRLRGIDSDNGTEFINQHLWDYCQAQEIQFTRGRPYQKDDNAHIEQKNWTHVRKLLGYERYDTPAAQAAIHALYRHELRLFQNFFLPSVKLLGKVCVGARVRRRYDAPRTPLERVLACAELSPADAARLLQQRARLDPFALAAAIEGRLERIYALASTRHRSASPSDPVLRPPRRRLSIKPSPHLTSTPAFGHFGDGAMMPGSVTSLNGSTGHGRRPGHRRWLALGDRPRPR